MTRLQRALLAMTIVGVVMCFVPLFNLLGYEASMLTSVTAGVLGMWCLHHEIGERRALDAHWEDAWMWFWRKSMRHLVLVLPPLVLLLLNALRVTNCDIKLGFLYWILITIPGVWLGQVLLWALSGRVGYRAWRWIFAILIVSANALAMGLHIAFEPPITGHQWLIGYFSGSIYDEALGVPTSLLWYRLTTLVGGVGVLVALEAWRRRHQTVGAAQLHPRGWVALALIFLFAWGGLTANEHHFGVRVDRHTIAKTLGGRLETEHFIIHYPQHQRFRDRLALLAEDHEFRYAEMKAYFGTDPVKHHGRKVHSFVYLDRDQKGDLMGARRTLIAKIWLREMHILWSGYGDHLLAHELAHIFTEPFGNGPLRLSARFGVFANMGLVEGVATAADDPPDDLSLHEASAAMRVMKIAPDIRKLVAAEGFWTQSSRRAYTLMGSFVRFLVKTYGIETFKKAYGSGDFEGAYQKSADTLVREWEQFIDKIKPRQEIMAIARYRYTRPSIFGKVCARTLAEMRRQKNAAQAGGNMARAMALSEEIMSYQKGRIRPQISHARLLLDAKQIEAAQALLARLLNHPKLTPFQRSQLLHLRGDVQWINRAYEGASADYRSCLDIGVPSGTQRMLQVKSHALKTPSETRALAKHYLVDRQGGATLFDAMQWRVNLPDDAVASYLVGRVLFGAGRWAEASVQFERAATGLGVGILQRENTLLLAQSLMHQRKLKRAKSLFAELAKSKDSRVRILASEWLARTDFVASNKVAFKTTSVE